MSDLNPQIQTVQVGIKKLRDITLYPLSIADQKKLISKISIVMDTVGTKMKKMGDVASVKFIIDLITENMQEIFKLVLETSEKIKMDELTNTQLADIAVGIYEANFEVPAKKLQALAKRFQPAIDQVAETMQTTSKEPLPKSSDKPLTD